MASLDIILPVFNPLSGWENTVIGRFQSLVKRLPDLKIRLFIVNDGSRNLNETEAVFNLKKAIPDLTWISYKQNRGKGYALRQGILQSHADFVVYTDIDWPYSEESMLDIVHALTDSTDVAVGVRNEGYYQQLPPARRKISKGLKKINGWLLRLMVDDTQAGLKGFRKHVKPVFLATTIDRYLFDLEFIFLLSRQKQFNVKGLPIVLRTGIQFSKMHSGVLFREGLNFLKIWIQV